MMSNTKSTTDRESFDSFDEALVGELRQVVLTRADEPQRRRGRRPALAAAGIAAVVAASFGINTLGTSSAFAVDRAENGDIRISIHRLDDASALARELASYGIDASVDYKPADATPGTPHELGRATFEGSTNLEDRLRDDLAGRDLPEGAAQAAPGGKPPASPCGDPSNPPLTTNLTGDDYVITIPKGSALTHADSKLRITTTGQIADSVAGLTVDYVIDGAQCGFGSMSAGTVPTP